MEDTEIIQINNQSLVRRVIEDHTELPLGMLASSDLRTLKALERQYWRRLYDAGVTREWKSAIALTYAPDSNGARFITFGRFVATMDKHFALTVKESEVIFYDDREAGRECCLPGEWMVELADTIRAEAERVRRVKERGDDELLLNQIMRLKG